MPLDYQNELFIQVDSQDRVIGKITRKKAHHNPQVIHRAVQVVLLNNKNQVLLQKRSAEKDAYSHYWGVSAGGHVSWGQTYQEAAHRELFEEIGVEDIPLKFVNKMYSKLETESEFNAIYIGEYNQTPTKIDKKEVTPVQWVNIDQLPQFIQTHRLTPTAHQSLTLIGLLSTRSSEKEK